MVAMPADANPSGDIFGGWIMSLMDMAGGQVAFQFAGSRIVTVAVDEIVFHVPVAVGDEVSCYAEVVRTGRTSIRTHVEVWTRRRAGGPRFKVTEGDYTYVLVNADGRPTPLEARLQRRNLSTERNTTGTSEAK
jgi:acyl-CoA thioesterase YciA